MKSKVGSQIHQEYRFTQQFFLAILRLPSFERKVILHLKQSKVIYFSGFMSPSAISAGYIEYANKAVCTPTLCFKPLIAFFSSSVKIGYFAK